MARPVHDPSRPPTRDRILAAAHARFAADGFSRATLAAIGRDCGVSRPSVLHHFPTKDALYAEVVATSFAALGGELARVMTRPAPFLDRVDAVVGAFEAFLGDHPGTARIIVRELLDEGPGQALLAEQVAPVLDAVVAFMEREGGPHLRPDLPVRAAVLQAAATVLIHDATPLRGQLWQGPSHAQALARSLFLPEVP